VAGRTATLVAMRRQYPTIDTPKLTKQPHNLFIWQGGMAHSLAIFGALRQDRSLCVSGQRAGARLARERRMKDQQRKRVGDALPRGLRRMRSWIRRQRKNKSRLRAWMSWSLLVIVIVGGLFAVSSTHLANIQNAINGITQPPVGQAVSSGSTP